MATKHIEWLFSRTEECSFIHERYEHDESSVFYACHFDNYSSDRRRLVLRYISYEWLLCRQLIIAKNSFCTLHFMRRESF